MRAQSATRFVEPDGRWFLDGSGDFPVSSGLLNWKFLKLFDPLPLRKQKLKLTNVGEWAGRTDSAAGVAATSIVHVGRGVGSIAQSTQKFGGQCSESIITTIQFNMRRNKAKESKA